MKRLLTVSLIIASVALAQSHTAMDERNTGSCDAGAGGVSACAISAITTTLSVPPTSVAIPTCDISGNCTALNLSVKAPMGPSPQSTVTEPTVTWGSGSFTVNPDGGTLAPVFMVSPISCVGGSWIEPDGGDPDTGSYSLTWSPAFSAGPVSCSCSPIKGQTGTCYVFAGTDGGTPSGSNGSATYSFFCCGPR